MDILFRDFRKYVAIIDRISICMHDTSWYSNYQYIAEVPADYDDYYVYGVGQTESEFECSPARPGKIGAKVITEGIEYLPCLEIMLSKEPRKFE